VQLAAVGFALLPFEPLDGVILERRGTDFALLGIVVAAVGVLVSRGALQGAFRRLWTAPTATSDHPVTLRGQW
jgi:hypothetical protein